VSARACLPERTELVREPRRQSVEGAERSRRRYAQITGMRGDDVLPRLLEIAKFRSEDSVRRAFESHNEEALTS
jgi:hypothetical protein